MDGAIVRPQLSLASRFSPVRPFAALPHDVAADPRLTPTDVSVLLALTFWARSKDHCWPSDKSVGVRVGRSPATVQRRLQHLESLGLIRRIKSDSNRTGRVIRLVWRGADEGGAPSPMREGGRSPVRDEGKRSVKGESSNPETAETAQRQRPEPAPEPPPVETVAEAEIQAPTVRRGETASNPKAVNGLAPTDPATVRPAPQVRPPAPTPKPPDNPGPTSSAREQALAWLASGDPILRAEAERRLKPRPEPKPEPATLAELLGRVRECPSRVPQAAELLAQTFDDRKSWSGYHAVVKRAFEGEIPAEALVRALERATDGKARNPAAVFMTVVGRGS